MSGFLSSVLAKAVFLLLEALVMRIVQSSSSRWPVAEASSPV